MKMKKITCIPEPHKHIEIISLTNYHPPNDMTITVGVREKGDNNDDNCEECGKNMNDKVYILPCCFHENHAECFLKTSEKNNAFICLICKRQLQPDEIFSWEISYVS